MNIHEEFFRYTQYCPMEKLVEATRLPIKFCPEPIKAILPSLVIGPDGPTLESLVLVSENFICEVRIGAPSQEFDFVAKKMIKNYRFSIREHEIQGQNQVKRVYQIAVVTLLHGFAMPSRFQTEIRYAGEDRDSWIKSVIDAVPLPSLLQSVA
jgi:hypothetical protein